MLWQKAWRESRWRFVAGLLMASVAAVVVVVTYPLVMKMKLDVPDLGERLNRQLQEMLALSSTYRGYVWAQWFDKNLLTFWTPLAVLLGAGGVLTEQTRGTALFTLSLPVTRRRLLGVRAALGAVELVVLSVAPSLLIVALSPLVGREFPLADALVHALVLATAGMVFYSFTLLLSSVTSDQIKQIVVGLMVVFAPALLSLISERAARYSIFSVMSGRSYFMSGELPVGGLILCACASVSMFVLALRQFERQEF